MTRPLAILWLGTALILSGCATMGGGQMRSLVPTRHEAKVGPFSVRTNFALPADAPALRQLAALERQVEATLGVRVDPRSAPIEVYILDNRESFSRFLEFHHPEFPPRRAFFLAQNNQRVVYTYAGDRLPEDLRHEATHALLNAAVGDVPLWLDEGLAEYFEGPDDRGGVNAEHLGRLPGDLQSGWGPDLRRLESLVDVRDMTPRDYREAWAWVHYLLTGPDPGKAALLAYLADLRVRPGETRLSDRLPAAGEEGPNGRLLAHLDRLKDTPYAAAPPAAAPPAKGSTFRLQDDPADATPPRDRRRGFFGRIGRVFGL